MEHEYSWEHSEGLEERRGDGFGWYMLVATVVALLVHVAFLIWGNGKVMVFEFAEPEEWVSEPVRLQEVEIAPEELPEALPEEAERPDEGSELLEEIEELLPEMQNVEIDISTEVEEAALPEMKLETPLLSGQEEGSLAEPVHGPEVNQKVPEIGQVENLFPEVQSGQLIVDQGQPIADVLDPTALVKEMDNQKGAGGLAANGSINGYTGLEAYSKMSPGDLQRNKASIGSDLLFAFNETKLKADARNSLMMVGMLIERNPDMYCWVEGHTDLFGGDDFNINLAQKRGEAVRDWLVNALRISPKRIIVRSFGKSQPLIKEGDADAQAPNRRVDIKMRKTLPPALKIVEPAPGKAIVVEEDTPPGVAVPVEEDEPAQAIPVEEDIPQAVPVEE